MADVVVDTHPVVGFVNTCAAPVLAPPRCSAPTTTVFPSPLTATLWPNRSRTGFPPDMSPVVNTAAILVFAHPVAGLVYTYAAGATEGSPEGLVPTTIVSPFALTDTERPNSS